MVGGTREPKPRDGGQAADGLALVGVVLVGVGVGLLSVPAALIVVGALALALAVLLARRG